MNEESGSALSRRKFLQAIGLAGAGAIVAACSSSKKGASASASTSSAPTPTASSAATSAASTPASSGASSAAASGVASAGASAVPGIPANADGPATLEFLWRSFPTEEAAFKTMMANYQKTYPDIKINQTYVAIAGYDQKVDLMTAGGTTPAVWDALNQRGIRYYASQNQCVILDPYVGSLFSTDDYPASYLELQKWNGKLCSLPNEVLTAFLVYNKTLFDKAGIPVPTKDWSDTSWNMDKFLDVAKALTDGKGQYGFLSWQDQRYEVTDFGVSYWSDAENATGYPHALNTSADFINALQFQQDLIYKYKVQPTPAETQKLGGANVPDLFTTGKFGMRVTYAGNLPAYAGITDFEWGLAPIPAPVSLPRLGYAYIGSLAVLTPQKNEKAALDLLAYMAAPEQQLLFPIQAEGWLSGLKSLAPQFADYMTKTYKLSADDLKVVSDAVNYCAPSPGSYAVEWQQFWDKSLSPGMDTIFNNTKTAAQAVADMQGPFKQIVQQTGK
jgi:multiple sugar transport system substrate-binding protein